MASLPNPSEVYDRSNEAQTRRLLEIELRRLIAEIDQLKVRVKALEP